MHEFTWDLMWSLVDGNEQRINIASECLDRHARDRTALRIQFDDGHTETYDFGRLSDLSSQWAHLLAARKVSKGDRVALFMHPSLHFYAGLFGILKLGAVAVPLYPLFGSEGLKLRLEYSQPKFILVTDTGMRQMLATSSIVLQVDAAVEDELRTHPNEIETATAASDDALIQFTSGTTRMMPQPICHKHRSVVTTLMPAIYGYGVAHEDRYLCVSPPSWGHGLSFGTIAPLTLGTAVGALSGKFDVLHLLQALQEFRITNISAAPTAYRALRNSNAIAQFDICVKKISYTGEALDADTFEFIQTAFRTPPCGVYGTAEASSFLANFCGFSGYSVKPCALGKPLPGKEVAVFLDSGNKAAPGEIGEIRLLRHGEWYRSKDIGYVDEDGYFFHAGRNDDVIISAGWTLSPLEIENVLLQHPDVLEAAVIAAPDRLRGYIPKAVVVAKRQDSQMLMDLQEFVKTRLSKNQYPRQIEFVTHLPRTAAGKIDRRQLRAMQSASSSGK